MADVSELKKLVKDLQTADVNEVKLCIGKRLVTHSPLGNSRLVKSFKRKRESN
jgi:hypothetical protein